MTSASSRYYEPGAPPMQQRRITGVTGLFDETDAVQFFDDFLGDALRDLYATDLSDGAGAAIDEQAGGVLRLSTDLDDDDHATLALALNLKLDRAGFLEVRLKQVSAATLRAVEVGLSDAKSETAGLAFSSPDTPTAVADDAVVFGYNTDEDAHWHLLSVNDGGTPQGDELAADYDAEADAWQTLRLEWDAGANVTFYIDGVRVGYHEAAVNAVAMTPWITLKSLSGAAKTVDVDYVRFAFNRE